MEPLLVAASTSGVLAVAVALLARRPLRAAPPEPRRCERCDEREPATRGLRLVARSRLG